MRVSDAIDAMLKKIRSEKVVDLTIYRRFKLASGWIPSWEDLKKQIENLKIMEIERTLLEHRRAHNKKITREFGIKKPTKGHNND